jgi:hypothetical protein
MSSSVNIASSIGSLIDLMQKPNLLKKKRQGVNLAYQFNDDEVEMAWIDAGLLIAKSYEELTKDDQFKNKFNVYLSHSKLKENKLNIDFLKDISVDELSELMNAPDKQKKIFAINKISGELRAFSEKNR